MISILDMWSDIGNAIVEAIRVLFSQIAFIIYDFIGVVYNLFIYISRAQILDNALVMSIYEKVGMILGLFMVFKLMFSLLQSLIDPSKFNDKKSGFSQVIIRLVLAIVLLGVTPTIFKEAYNIQNLLVGSNDGGNNVFYKLIVGSNVNGDATSFGKTLSTELYFSFFTDEEYPYMVKTSDQEGTVDTSDMTPIEALKNRILTEGKSFAITKEALAERGNDSQTHTVEFNFLFVVIVGAVVLWILFMYCFQVAVRVFQLAYLQLIAPIPIFSYISDPDGVFKKWVSQCVATYIDLFIRLCIIYFIVFLSTHVLEQLNNADSILVSSLGGIDPTMLFFVKVVLLVGLLFFAKKVPDLLKDLFPKLGGAGKFSFGLNPKKELFDPIVKSAPGKAIGWLGNKAFSTYDRIKYNTPKPRGKFGQFLDKKMPGRAEVIKNKRQALADAKQWNMQENKGKQIYDYVRGELADENGKVKPGVFKNQSYIDTWNKKNAAKKQVNATEEIIKDLSRELNGVYYDPNLTKEQKEEKKEILKKQLDNAEKILSAAKGAYSIAEGNHKKNQDIYKKDADTEKLFEIYANLHKKPGKLDDGIKEIEKEHSKRRFDSVVSQRESLKNEIDQMVRTSVEKTKNDLTPKKHDDLKKLHETIDDLIEKKINASSAGEAKMVNAQIESIRNEMYNVIRKSENVVLQREKSENEIEQMVMASIEKTGKDLTPKQYADLTTLQNTLDDLIEKKIDAANANEASEINAQINSIQNEIYNVINNNGESGKN